MFGTNHRGLWRRRRQSYEASETCRNSGVAVAALISGPFLAQPEIPSTPSKKRKSQMTRFYRCLGYVLVVLNLSIPKIIIS